MSDLKDFEDLSKMLMRHEGVESYVYQCSTGKETIGVGRNISPNGGIGLSEDEIVFLLVNDIKRCKEELKNNFDWFEDLNTARQHAMIDIVFNLGITRLLKFKKALAFMVEQDYFNASEEFLDSRWATQVGHRAEELAEMIHTGEYISCH